MINFNETKDQAMAQLEKDWASLYETLGQDPEHPRLAEAILKLRELDEMRRFTLCYVLSGKPNEFISDFNVIMNRDEHLREISALDALISSLWYNIEDDGFLNLMRLEVEDDLKGLLNNEHFPNRKQVFYFLYTDDYTEPLTLAKGWFLDHSTLPPNPKLISAKSAGFGSLKQLTDFIELLGEDASWDEWDLKHAGVDKLMGFKDEKELITAPISRREELRKRIEVQE